MRLGSLAEVVITLGEERQERTVRRNDGQRHERLIKIEKANSTGYFFLLVKTRLQPHSSQVFIQKKNRGEELILAECKAKVDAHENNERLWGLRKAECSLSMARLGMADETNCFPHCNPTLIQLQPRLTGLSEKSK